MTKNNFNGRTLFALPYLIYMLIFVVIPLGMLFFYAFYNDGTGFSFDAVTTYFTDAGQWRTLGRSLLIALTAALLCVAIGYPLAYLVSRMKHKTAQYATLMALVAPMWVNGLLRTVALKDLASLIGIPNGEFLLILGLTIDYLPFMMMPIYTVITGINRSYLEVSADLGAKPITTFVKVELPLSMSGVMSGFLMVFAPAVSTYYMSEYLGDGTFMIGEQLNMMFTKTGNQSGAAVIALVLLAIVGLSVVITNRLSRLGNRRGGLY